MGSIARVMGWLMLSTVLAFGMSLAGFPFGYGMEMIYDDPEVGTGYHLYVTFFGQQSIDLGFYANPPDFEGLLYASFLNFLITSPLMGFAFLLAFRGGKKRA